MHGMLKTCDFLKHVAWNVKNMRFSKHVAWNAKNMWFSKHVEIWKGCAYVKWMLLWLDLLMPLLNGKRRWGWWCMQAGGMSVILGLVEATQRVSFHPGALLWGRSWTSGLFGGYKARSELPNLVERCMKGVSNLFIYAYKFPYNLTYLSTHDHPPTFLCSFCLLNYNSNHFIFFAYASSCLVKIKSKLKISFGFSHREIIPYLVFWLLVI